MATPPKDNRLPLKEGGKPSFKKVSVVIKKEKQADSMRKKLTVGLAYSLVIVASLSVGLALRWRIPSPSGNEGVLPARTAIAPKTNRPTREIAVLFIGNSYTFRNDLPGMLISIAKSDAKLPFSLVTRSVTVGNASLTDLWNQGYAKRILDERHWDYVVMQEHSLWTTTPALINMTMQIADTWKSAIPANSAVLVYETWPRKPGTNWYHSADYQQLQSFELMRSKIAFNTGVLARRLNAQVVWVGEQWSQITEKSNIDLYDQDGSHPNLAGTYLSALVFYRQITGRSGSAIQWQPDISEQVAKQLKSIF